MENVLQIILKYKPDTWEQTTYGTEKFKTFVLAKDSSEYTVIKYI